MRLIDDAIRYWQRVLSEAEWNEDEERARVARLSIDELVAERERGELYEISFWGVDNLAQKCHKRCVATPTRRSPSHAASQLR